MKPSENYTDVTINERTFRIKKFNALTGSYMILKIQGLLAPLVKSLDLNKLLNVEKVSDVDLGAFNFSYIMTELANISEKDFSYIQKNCLKVCSEMLPAGLAPVLNDNDTFGVNGLDDDTMTVMALTVHAIIFNVKGFFQGSPLQKLFPGLSTISPRG